MIEPGWWSCAKCFWINVPERKTCRICGGTERDHDPASGDPDAAAAAADRARDQERDEG